MEESSSSVVVEFILRHLFRLLGFHSIVAVAVLVPVASLVPVVVSTATIVVIPGRHFIITGGTIFGNVAFPLALEAFNWLSFTSISEPSSASVFIHIIISKPSSAAISITSTSSSSAPLFVSFEPFASI